MAELLAEYCFKALHTLFRTAQPWPEKTTSENHCSTYSVDSPTSGCRWRISSNNSENIRSLHYLLADGLVPAGMAGNLRDEGVRISSSTYMPLEGRSRLEPLLELIASTAAKIHSPFEQSFFLLTHIAYLQGFIDVNKRTSRMSANIPLVRHNLVPLSFNDISKDDYASAVIAVYELNDTAPLAELYV